MRPEPETVDMWGLTRPDRLPNLSKKLEGFALHLFGRVWRPIGPLRTPQIDDFRLRPKPWLQIPRTLGSPLVALVLCPSQAGSDPNHRFRHRPRDKLIKRGGAQWPNLVGEAPRNRQLSAEAPVGSVGHTLWVSRQHSCHSDPGVVLKRSGFIGPRPPGVQNHSGPEPEWF